MLLPPSSCEQLSPQRGSDRSEHICVLLGPVHGAEPLHVLLNVLLGLVLHVLVALQVFGVLASLQLLVHDSVSELRHRAEIMRERFCSPDSSKLHRKHI